MQIESKLLRQGLVFLGIYALFEFGLIAAGLAGLLDAPIHATASLTYSLVRLTGLPAVASGNQIVLSNRVLLINADCTGFFIIAVFAALVLAHPAPWREKGLALMVGVPVILVANLVRLVAVAHVAVSFPAAFTVVHDYIFQVGMVLLAAAVWWWWLGRLGRLNDEE